MEKTEIKLPENFESYPEMRKKSFMAMKTAKETTGANVIGSFCSFVPSEIIYAAKALPVGLCSFTDEPIPAAEVDLPRNLCPLIKSSYGSAITDTCPFFYFSDLIVGETTCDGKMKMFELLNDNVKDTYVMQLPHNRSEASLMYWRDEIKRFKETLEAKFNITITEEDIKESIHNMNEMRNTMREFLELGSLVPAPVSGYEMGTRTDAGAFSFDLQKRIANIKARTAEIKADWEANYKGKEETGPRILVTGCPNAGVKEKTIRAIEEMGAHVVVFDTCNGIRNNMELVDENEPDVYLALAKKYINTNCSVMSPNNGRREYLDWMIDTFHVDGVMEIVLQSCHTYDVEAYYIKKFVTEQKGIPYIGIETDYSQSDKGQLNTRIAAFLETINK